MTIESASYLSGLVAANPAFDDDKSEGDDHIRLIKTVLLATLPNLGGRAWRVQTKGGNYTVVAGDNMTLIDVTASATISFTAAATLGNGHMIVLRNSHSAAITLDPNGAELINGAATLSLEASEVAVVFCTGTAFIAVLAMPDYTTRLAPYLLLAGGTLTGTLTINGGATLGSTLSCADQIVDRPYIKDYAETVNTVASSGTTETLDYTTGNVHDVTLTDNCTFTFSNPPASGRAGGFTLILRQDGTGSRTVTWPASVQWDNAADPVLSTGANDIDIFSFITVDGGTTWFGFTAGQNMS